MKLKICRAALLALLAAVSACVAQVPEVVPVLGRAIQESQITTVYLAPRFATAIRMPDAVNSVVLGDPDSFSAEHSDKEPQIVFVKPINPKATQTNLLISTVRGYGANLLLISRGEMAGMPRKIDFVMRYRPAGGFLIEPSAPSSEIAETKELVTGPRAEKGSAAQTGEHPSERSAISGAAGIIGALFVRTESVTPPMAAGANVEPAATHEPQSELDRLLERQRRAPLPVLYDEKPGIAPPGKQLLKAGVSEVIDQGKEVVVLFSVLNVQDHAVQLMPPQIQLAGKVKKGAIVHHKVWSNSEQLPVEAYRLSRRRLGAGERADGVAVFQRPSFKQSNETLLLQMADSGAVDRPAFAPIGFGISKLREEGGE
jgi:hypothetical protein